MAEKKNLKPWQGWALFGGSMVVVFLLGLACSSLMERRAEVASIFNNRQVKMENEIEARNAQFATDFSREYETWQSTADTTFTSEFCGQKKEDVLEQRPDMVILWAGYAFSWDYTTPRGHMYAIDDMRETLRTFAPMNEQDKQQPGTCWTCKSPDVPRLMAEVGEENFYSAPWSKWGDQVVNPIGCSDCHDARTMDLRISRPALRNAFAAMGKDIDKATHQEMRSLVCAQCHVEYYFAGDKKVATFPWKNGLTLEDAEAYYDSIQFTDYEHALSKAPILKAQHPGYEMSLQGIHGQRGVSCADCHMPYKSEGGIKY
ncbi:MAG: ammonia-forming cytochrome c nitrite reductase subunit c552, partial [Bacteroidales bacterium]|nr:ammonia-forming cytochrome c nitrite reductase subunit c552 [Candidatus Sodaliphilus fimicaballi]